MTLRDLIGSVRRHLLTVVITGLVFVGGIGALSATADPVYRSSASLYFSLDVGSSASDFNQGSAYTQSQMLSFAQLVTLPVVLDPVIDDLGLDVSAQQLARTVSVSRPQDTVILEIAVSTGNPERAAQVANGIASQLADTVEELAPRDALGQSTVTARVVKDALVPEFQIAPNTRRNIALAAAMGLLAGLVLAYLRDALDTRIRTKEDVAAVVGVPVLGQVSRRAKGVVPTDGLELAPSHAEEYRRLRTSLRFVNVENAGLSMVISSAMPGEGKTTTCVNLALALAEAELKVVVVDADLRRPRIAHTMGLEGAAGLTSVLIGAATVDEVIQPWGRHRIDVVAAGEIPPNPSELVATKRLTEVVDDLRARYDVVLMDAPPLLPVADAAVLSRSATGVLLVADTRRLRRHQLKEVVNEVTVAGGQVLGVVLNRVKGRALGPYRYESYEETATRRGGGWKVARPPAAGGRDRLPGLARQRSRAGRGEA